MEKGWIRLHRKMRENWIWSDPVKFKWWCDILLQVNHDEKIVKVNIGLQNIDCGRGQSIMSLQNWAERWNVSKGCARAYLGLLCKENMITMESVTKSTRITVCNYDFYNPLTHALKTHGERIENALKTHGDPNKKEEEGRRMIKNEKNVVPPTLEMVKNYCLLRKNNINPEQFIDKNEAKGWMIGKTKMKDWQATIRTWEKYENNSRDSKRGTKSINQYWN